MTAAHLVDEQNERERNPVPLALFSDSIGIGDFLRCIARQRRSFLAGVFVMPVFRNGVFGLAKPFFIFRQFFQFGRQKGFGRIRRGMT